MNIRHVWNLLFNREKFEKAAKITPSNVIGFLQGNFRSFASNIEFLKPAPYIIEQSYWRLSQVEKKSPECLKGQCKVCGCSTNEIVFEDRPCKGDCYPKMMTALEWEFYKKDNNIQVDI